MANFFIRIIFPALALLLLVIAIVFAFSHPEPKPANPPFPVPSPPFRSSVAGIGVIEPQNGNVEIASSQPGIVSKIFVKVGQQVKIGNPLFKLDDSTAQAQINLAKVQLQSAKNAQEDLPSNSPKSSKRLAKSKVNEAQANLDLAQTHLDNLTIYAPVNGTVLKINIVPGGAAQTPRAMILGDIEKTMWVRVEIDETDIARLKPNAPAIGIIRGAAPKKVDLKFVRIEPMVSPILNVNPAGNEIIDTRVMKVIYSFDNSQIKAYPGQQMDVFVEVR